MARLKIVDLKYTGNSTPLRGHLRVRPTAFYSDGSETAAGSYEATLDVAAGATFLTWKDGNGPFRILGSKPGDPSPPIYEFVETLTFEDRGPSVLSYRLRPIATNEAGDELNLRAAMSGFEFVEVAPDIYSQAVAAIATARFETRGAYSGAATYAFGDVVSHGGASWRWVSDVPGNVVPAANAAQWFRVADKGDTGPANVLGVGSVTTGAPGTNAAVNITGAAPNQQVSFTIPRGDKGERGVNWRGAWNAATAYAATDGVQYQGRAFVALQASTNVAPPASATSTATWSLLSDKGSGGAAVVQTASGDLDFTPESGPVVSAPSLANFNSTRASSVAALRARTAPSALPVQVSGYHGTLSGGGGWFDPDLADTASADDGYTVIVALDGPGGTPGTRYKRRLDPTTLRAEDAGWKADGAYGENAPATGTDNGAVLTKLMATAVSTGIRRIQFPHGLAYIGTGTFAVPSGGIEFIGMSQRNTVLLSNATGDVFRLGAFSLANIATNPYWNDAYQNTSFRHLSLVRPQGIVNAAGAGTRQGIGIRDNGAGALTVERCTVQGFQYGIALVHGSDFSLITHSTLMSNDVGFYAARVSDQTSVEHCSFFVNREAIVREGSDVHFFRNHIVDSVLHDIHVQANSTSRFGVPLTATMHETPVVFESTWIEANAGYGLAGDFQPVDCIKFSGDINGSLPRYVYFKGVKIVHGTLGGSKVTNSIFKAPQGIRFRVEDLHYEGGNVTYIVDNGFVGQEWDVRGLMIAADGYTLPQVFRAPDYATKYSPAPGILQSAVYGFEHRELNTPGNVARWMKDAGGHKIALTTVHGGVTKVGELDLAAKTITFDGTTFNLTSSGGAAVPKATLFRWLPAQSTANGTIQGVNHAVSGTISHPAPATTNDATARYRLQADSGTSPSTMGELRIATATLSRAQGFSIDLDFACPTITAETQFFAGICNSTVAYGSGALIGNPSAVILDGIGLGIDYTESTTGNWMLQTNDNAGSATRVDTGIAKSATTAYRLRISCARGGASFTVTIYNLATGAQLYTTTLSADIPASTTFMAPRIAARTVNGGTGNNGIIWAYRIEAFEA